jgi:hypothetical protein
MTLHEYRDHLVLPYVFVALNCSDAQIKNRYYSTCRRIARAKKKQGGGGAGSGEAGDAGGSDGGSSEAEPEGFGTISSARLALNVGAKREAASRGSSAKQRTGAAAGRAPPAALNSVVGRGAGSVASRAGGITSAAANPVAWPAYGAAGIAGAAVVDDDRDDSTAGEEDGQDAGGGGRGITFDDDSA